MAAAPALTCSARRRPDALVLAAMLALQVGHVRQTAQN
jgi:hypothetical protein